MCVCVFLQYTCACTYVLFPMFKNVYLLFCSLMLELGGRGLSLRRVGGILRFPASASPFLSVLSESLTIFPNSRRN